MIKGIH